MMQTCGISILQVWPSQFMKARKVLLPHLVRLSAQTTRHQDKHQLTSKKGRRGVVFSLCSRNQIFQKFYIYEMFKQPDMPNSLAYLGNGLLVIGLSRTSQEYRQRFLRTDKNYNFCINFIKMLFNILDYLW